MPRSKRLERGLVWFRENPEHEHMDAIKRTFEREVLDVQHEQYIRDLIAEGEQESVEEIEAICRQFCGHVVSVDR